jgi:septal ring factor EnvC (AmiA/AmiB activator)
LTTPEAPRSGDVAPYVEDDRAATLADVRGLRRWLAVTAVWAIAATALGVFALIEANKNDDAAKSRSAGELTRLQRDLNNRIDDLESRIDELPTSDDLRKLENRVNDVEDAADKTRADSKQLQSDLDELTKRVDEVEQQQESAGTQTTETTP